MKTGKDFFVLLGNIPITAELDSSLVMMMMMMMMHAIGNQCHASLDTRTHVSFDGGLLDRWRDPPSSSPSSSTATPPLSP